MAVVEAILSWATVVAVTVMACWPRGSRRFGLLGVLLAWASLVVHLLGAPGAWPTVATLGAVLVTAFWLIDRGIPGNRRRPTWVRLLAIVMVIAALGAAVLAAGSR